jgi:protein-tyrosine-phosphatase
MGPADNKRNHDNGSTHSKVTMLPYAPLLSLPKVSIMPTKPHKLLLLCTGNTCRSQMAHAMAYEWSQTNDLNLQIESRGIRANLGDPTTPEALLVLARASINWHGTSQLLSAEDLQWADDVWGMTQEHLDFAASLGAELGVELDQERTPNYQLLTATHELVDPLNAGLEAYEQLFCSLQELLPNRLAAILKPSEA